MDKINLCFIGPGTGPMNCVICGSKEENLVTAMLLRTIPPEFVRVVRTFFV